MKRLQKISNTLRSIFILLGIAILVGLLHMMPFWHAQAQTPTGYVFTGNINNSPDLMQYRVWSRQAIDFGLDGFG